MVLFTAFYLLASQGPVSDRDVLTSGVHELDPGGGAPGAMVASGDPAFVVVAAGKEGSRVPEFVAAHVGSGRVLAGGHESFFEDSQLSKADNRRFFLNGLEWLAGKPLARAHVGYMG